MGKIKNIVKYVCGSAYAKSQNSLSIRVRLKGLPTENTVQLKEQLKKAIKALPDRQYLPRTTSQIFLESSEVRQIKQLFEKIVQMYQKAEKQELMIKDFIDHTIDRINHSMDEFIFKDSHSEEESSYSVLTYQVRETFDWMRKNYGLEQGSNRMIALARYPYHKNNTDMIAENHEW